MKNKKIIAIIPARGGSKGIPRKNIKLLARKPLIAYTIEAALKSKCFDRVIVSTENKEIAGISKKWGAEIIKRPKILGTDTAKTVDVIFRTLEILKKKNYRPDVVVLLQPTSPLRTVNDIKKTIKLFLKNKCESLISVCQTERSPYWSFQTKKKYLEPIFGWKYLKKRRQDLPELYMPNGAVYISSPKNLLKYKSFYSKKILPYIIPVERSIDIDNKMDFKLAELIIKNEKNKNRK